MTKTITDRLFWEITFGGQTPMEKTENGWFARKKHNSKLVFVVVGENIYRISITSLYVFSTII